MTRRSPADKSPRASQALAERQLRADSQPTSRAPPPRSSPRAERPCGPQLFPVRAAARRATARKWRWLWRSDSGG